MSVRRRAALVVLAVVLAICGLTALYVRNELADRERFADRAVEALQSQEVRSAIGEQVAVEMLERGAPDLVASRPLVLTAVEAVLETEQFERVLRRSALTAHAVLFDDDRDVVVELEDARAVLAEAVATASPEVARQIPSDISPRIAEIRRTDVATWAVRLADGASVLAWPLLLAAAALLGLAVRLAPDTRHAVVTSGAALAAGAVVGLLALAALRMQVVSGAGEVGVLAASDARAAAGAAWRALAGSLHQWLVVTAVVGLAVSVGALIAEARVDRAAALRRAADAIAGGRLPRALRLLRGLAVAGLGALIVFDVEPVRDGAVVVVGGALLLLGIAEAASTGRRRARAAGSPLRVRWPVLAGAGAAVAVAAAVGVALLDRGGAPEPPPTREITACNGMAELCPRRLDQVVLPGTHNSMSAADRPGWFFANQTRPVPRQLEDGIRLLMIDPHYGVVDARGRVRTDLAAEGTSRNRVARALGPDAVRAAERLAGRLGLVPSGGKREIFLCHTLCELGAERMRSTLNEVRGFLERNPAEVLVVFVESSVDVAEVEEELRDAELEPYLAELDPAAPLPSLREMISSGRRLLVLDQGDGGEEPWYRAGFNFIQDTRIRSLLTSTEACDPGRGTPESPLLLMNHWIDRFPPPLTANAEIGARRPLLDRVESCRGSIGRIPNLIAVDFYERGDVIEAARTLNRDGVAAR